MKRAPRFSRFPIPMHAFLSIAAGLTVFGVALLAVPQAAMHWAARSSPEVVFQIDTEKRLVALTIDDGPSEATAEILRVLEEHEARATFFVIGRHVEERPDVAREIVAAGHELGHHMMLDEPSRSLPDEVFASRFDEMDGILADLGGSRIFRPGSGWFDDRMVRVAGKRGYRTVLGSVYPFDAHLPWAGFLAWYVRTHTEPGSVIVLHDGPERGLRTAEVLASVLPELTRRGFELVTVSELLARAGDG